MKKTERERDRRETLTYLPFRWFLSKDVVGPADAKRAIVDIIDIFGLAPQTIQGADLLASLTKTLVLVPDFFHGDPADHDWLPMDTDEKKQKLGSWFGAKADFKKNAEVLLAIRKELAAKYPAVDEHVGVFGLCWGGKSKWLALFFFFLRPGEITGLRR